MQELRSFNVTQFPKHIDSLIAKTAIEILPSCLCSDPLSQIRHLLQLFAATLLETVQFCSLPKDSSPDLAALQRLVEDLTLKNVEANNQIAFLRAELTDFPRSLSHKSNQICESSTINPILECSSEVDFNELLVRKYQSAIRKLHQKNQQILELTSLIMANNGI